MKVKDTFDEVEMTKLYVGSEEEIIKQINLNRKQVSMLISLFDESKFTRIVKHRINYISASDKDRYVIKGTIGEYYIHLRSYGGECVSIGLYHICRDDRIYNWLLK